jgi:lipoprotein-anchoring transpeptidase ErfK/SrfK
MWLDGLEAGNKTSKERFIYIHGTGEEGRIGTPASHGCIRMRNKDVIELFERVDEDTLVVITQKHEG